MEQKNSISNYIANLHEVHVHLSLNLHNIWNCDHSQLKYYKWVSEEWSIYTKTYHISKSTPGYFFLSKKMNTISVSSVESLSCVWHFVNPLTATWTPWALGLPGPPCPSPTPRIYPNSCPLSWWCHPIISFSLVLSPSPPALNLSQHQGLFKWLSSLHQVAKVLEFQLQHKSFQWAPRTDLL